MNIREACQSVLSKPVADWIISHEGMERAARTALDECNKPVLEKSTPTPEAKAVIEAYLAQKRR